MAWSYRVEYGCNLGWSRLVEIRVGDGADLASNTRPRHPLLASSIVIFVSPDRVRGGVSLPHAMLLSGELEESDRGRQPALSTLNSSDTSRRLWSMEVWGNNRFLCVPYCIDHYQRFAGVRHSPKGRLNNYFEDNIAQQMRTVWD